MKGLKKADLKNRSHGGCENAIFVSYERWTTRSIFLAAFLFRVLLVFYGRIHDYLFKVRFTDVDYKVFSDAAKYVYDGRSPFLRHTYRYSPVLAWILVPTVLWPEFGKLLFCSLDILVGWLCFKLACGATKSSTANFQKTEFKQTCICVIWLWLLNPVTAVISARGNADVLVCAAIVTALYFILKKKWFIGAILHGLAVHLKLYPVIYFLSVFLYLSGAEKNSDIRYFGKKVLLNWKGIIFTLVSFVVSIAFFSASYWLYGASYFDEAIIYHVTRSDTRHNFSPYFYILYLSNEDLSLSRLVSIGSFLPQMGLVVYFSFRYYEDLPFCWLITTISFVTFNKVCTSQYFVWYICLLPAVQSSLQISKKRTVTLILLWFFGQLLWLIPAYLFEFKGYNTFLYIWLASLLFLLINSAIIVQLCSHHYQSKALFSQKILKKVQ